MTQTSQPRKASFDNKDVSPSSDHPATDLSDGLGDTGEASELLSKHISNEGIPPTSAPPSAKCCCLTVSKCSRREHHGYPFLPSESDKLAFVTLLSYLLVIATVVLFFVVHDPVNLRCDGENSTREGQSQGPSKSELRTHGLLVFLRGMLGSFMGYLMGFPLKRLADCEGFVVESLKRENRKGTGTIGIDGHVILDTSGGNGHPGLNALNREHQNITSSSGGRRSDDTVIDVDPMAKEGRRAKYIKEAEEPICGICHKQYEKDEPVKDGAMTEDDRMDLSGRTCSVVMLGLGRLLLVAQMAALGVWWE